MSGLSPEADPNVSEPFFRVQRCSLCGLTQHYERPCCVRCGSRELHLVAPSGRGTLHSFTVVHRSPLPRRWSAPYVLALVRLEEGPIVMSHVVDANEEMLTCELPVQATWMAFDDGERLPVFRLQSSPSD